MPIEPFDKHYSRTLDSLKSLPSTIADVWLFEPRPARLAVERSLAETGRTLRIHSAYKCLLHSVLEQDLFVDAIAVTIRYPVVEHDEPLRFRLECYPLQDLFSHIDIQFLAVDHCGDSLPAYQLSIRTETEQFELSIAVPVRWKAHPAGRQLLVASGWMQSSDGQSVPMVTDYEQLYDDICAYLQVMPMTPMHPSEPGGPFFDQLDVCVTAPFQDEPMPVGNEAISLAEALHEEIYFTAIEIFQQRLGLPPMSRELKPGQVVPRISRGETVSLSIRANQARLAVDRDQAGCPVLSQATHWLYPSQVKSCLNQIDGQPILAMSRQGRVVEGRIVRNGVLPEQAMLAISGAQHANESSGVIGALRAALDLQQTGKLAFTVCPVENVDGYALYHSLCLENANHMHHAARYSAGGNDLTHGEGMFESAIRHNAYDLLPARVHVNLHGYPAHEWTRPLSGYVPQGFSRWTIPKGFFLICDYADESQLTLATQVLDAALEALYEFPEMMAVNRRMLRSYESVVGSLDFELYRDCIPYTLTQRPREPYSISLITEAPDESIYGEDFRIAHEAQYRVIMAVAELLASQVIPPIDDAGWA
ncbi:hypothetical protein [Granulosicoccus antarcticus]|uniref:Peptidase M14 carboxypeptidase A domain-containing protein n=1 Tax=Granulosicoccus antarcticus IMCC3135 TaxID=1192854 RepID=A0A2Z2NU59_9GAMM|nr:hypothetical protein [Granulosicoccus antarcticus]ASJ73268.1 hypothetical protein IMCC3135_15930 [Granulosicoccus antarcticus IMCC3135]